MKHDPRLARPQPPLTATPTPTPPGEPVSLPVSGVMHRLRLEAPALGAAPDDAEARRLWALGLIATCGNNSVLFGEVSAAERLSAAQEILRLARLRERVLK